MRQLSRSMQSVVTDVRVDWGADLTAALVLSTTPTRPVFSGDRVSCYGVFRRALLPSSATVTLSIKGPSGGQSWALPLEFAAPVDAPVDAPAAGAVARLRGRAVHSMAAKTHIRRLERMAAQVPAHGPDSTSDSDALAAIRNEAVVLAMRYVTRWGRRVLTFVLA